ncbi:MAG: tetratricopeptide repeat protein [Anaerolineae bacterium]
MPTIDRNSLLDLLDQKLSAEDLNDLAFALRLDVADLEGATKRGRLRSLIEYFERRDQMGQLLDAIRKQRPDILAADVTYAALAEAPSAAAEPTADASQTATIASLSDIIARDPTNAQAYFDRAEMYRDQGDYQSAIPDYTRATLLLPGYAPAYSGLANCYLDSGDSVRALENYNKAIELDKDPYDIMDRGQIYVEQGNLEAAIKDFTEAIRLKPDLSWAYYYRGLAYGRQKDNEKAVADLKQAASLDSDLKGDIEEDLRKLGVQ